MPEVHVFMVEGRSEDVKKALMKDISDAVQKNCSVDPENITVQIIEAPLTHKMKGGRTFAERLKK